jgi:hypothetical protein
MVIGLEDWLMDGSGWGLLSFHKDHMRSRSLSARTANYRDSKVAR